LSQAVDYGSLHVLIEVEPDRLSHGVFREVWMEC
jgi:hypothetical protein